MKRTTGSVHTDIYIYIYIYIILTNFLFEITSPIKLIILQKTPIFKDFFVRWRNRSFWMGLNTAAGGLVLLVSVVLSGVLINAGDMVFAATHTLTLATSGAQSIDVSSTGTGTAISADNITVTTTCRAGYNLSLSTSVSNNNLYLNGDSTNNTAGTYFSPSDGTTALSQADNTWGYYLPASGGNAPTANTVFNPVPILDSPVTLKTPAQTASATDISDSFSVYYGVSVSSDMAFGAYKMISGNDDGALVDGSLVYYATLAEDCMKYTVVFNPTSTAGGTTVSGTGTMSNQTIFEDVATPLTTNGFTAPSGYEFIGWNTAQDGTGTSYTNGQSVTNLTTVGSTITLYAQWDTPCAGGYICYEANGNNVVGTMGNQTVSSTATSITLLASNYSRANYGFAGWNTKADGSGTNYGPQETITFAAGQYFTTGLKLYANWIASAGNIQNWSGCSSLASGAVTALTDQRDNQTYAIAKLADGKCWMIENLRLDNTAELTLANTNNPLNNGTNVTLKHNYTDTDTYNTLSATSDVAYDADTAPDGWCTLNSSACDDQSRLRTDNTVNRATYTSGQIVSNQNANTYSYGNYYNWYSATAGRGTYSFSTNNNSVAGDLCPAGWRLPKGGNKTRIESDGDNEFWNLAVVALNNGTLPANYSSSTYPYYTGTEAGPVDKALRTYPNNYLYSGGVNGGSVGNRGSVGYFWSSTAYGSSYAYYLYLYSSNVYPGTNSYSKYDGRSVRCVAQ